MLIDRVRLSYEGEGDLLGLQTFFCHYPGEDNIVSYENLLVSVAAVYINSDFDSEELGEIRNLFDGYVTIEMDISKYQNRPIPGVRYVLDADSYYECAPKINGFIKISVYNEMEFEDRCGLANRYSRDGFQVLLMPEWSVHVGEVMLRSFGKLNRFVRLMPPVHRLLGIS